MNNLQTVLSDYSTILPHYQIQGFSVHALILASEYKKMQFPCLLNVHVPVIFQNYAYIQNLERSPSETMLCEMSEFATLHQESTLTFGTRKPVVFIIIYLIPPYTPLLYSKIGVYRGIHYFHIFALKHRLAAPVADWVRSLYFSALNHSIISPLCLV